MTATMAPIAACGNITLIHPVPTTRINKAISVKIKPTTRNPPRADEYPFDPSTIKTGERNAKLDPKNAGIFPFVITI
ncbi:hypothetical protein D3C85_1814990 [compost metagenome]